MILIGCDLKSQAYDVTDSLPDKDCIIELGFERNIGVEPRGLDVSGFAQTRFVYKYRES